MKHDLDRLMAERDIDAIVVEGPDGLGNANPDFNYFVKGAHLTGTVIKKRGEPAMLPLDTPKLESVLRDASGQPITTLQEWEKRRQELREDWLQFLGPPPPSEQTSTAAAGGQ